MDSAAGPGHMIFQLGTNNWQRDGEFAPGSGILHEAHHRALNAMPGVDAYSMYPSRRQRLRESHVRVFALEHDIPICESISPVSRHRWHGMNEAEVGAYRRRLTAEAGDWMAEIEAAAGRHFTLAIAHHAFMNTVVLRDVIRARTAAGRPRLPLVCFTHGTELKMFAHERDGDDPREFPPRFLPFMHAEGIFDPTGHAVDVVAAISTEQVQAFSDLFPGFPRERIVLSPNGYNQDVFCVPDDDRPRDELLAAFRTVPYEGSRHVPRAIGAGFDAVVVFCGKFAAWKRLDALLRAAASYEDAGGRRIATLVVGSGPHRDQVLMQDLADELGLAHVFFLGPREQNELATLFRCADVGCFPSQNEPFGLVFLECMACGTPVIGADSGGPRDFVTAAVGELVPETDDANALAASLANAVLRAIDEGWKHTRGPAAAAYASTHHSVQHQVEHLVVEIDRLTAGDAR